MDYAVIGVYLLGMVGAGWWGRRRATTRSDYLVAGRRLGWFMYSGTLSAVVLGGASTIGGVALGYRFGLSGAWLVLAIGVGILALSTLFARRIVRLRIYTVSEMLDLRYGGSTSAMSGAVMWGYTLMLSVTSTIAYSTIFTALFGIPRTAGVVLGGVIVLAYSVLGGMWSVTLTDIVQLVITIVGVLCVLLPMSVSSAGGFVGMWQHLEPAHFDLVHIGGTTILTYLLTYSFGLLIGQDVWQRVFTARGTKVATWGGVTSGVYCVFYAFAGALIGTAASVLYPGLASPDAAFATIVQGLLPAGLRGLVLAAALAAMMSTASGALIACATVAANDIVPALRRRVRTAATGPDDDVASNRRFTLALGVLAILLAVAFDDVVAALTVAYNVLVGGLLVAILGGLVWKRATRAGALTSMVLGTVTVVVTMALTGLTANAPIYCGLFASLVGYVVVSLATRRPSPEVLRAWEERLHDVGEDDGHAAEASGQSSVPQN